MGERTAIEWTEATWNPVRGCSIVSPGCTNCYAMRQAHRHSGHDGAYAGLTKKTKGGPVWTGEVRTVPELLGWPLRKKNPRRIFVNSMSDLFHESVPDEFIDQVFAVMALCPQHTFQILTKRARRLQEYLTCALAGERIASILLKWGDLGGRWWPFEGVKAMPAWAATNAAALLAIKPLRQVWLGISVEDQKRADERIPLLLHTPAAVRWVSAEPLLGPVDLTAIDALGWAECYTAVCARGRLNALTGWCYNESRFEDGRWEDNLHPTDEGHHGKAPRKAQSIDWVVAGGESGLRARPMHPDWPRSLRDQCRAAGVPYYFKQWGAWLPEDQPESGRFDPEEENLHFWPDKWSSIRVGKLAAGRVLDGRTHDEYPQARPHP